MFVGSWQGGMNKAESGKRKVEIETRICTNLHGILQKGTKAAKEGKELKPQMDTNYTN